MKDKILGDYGFYDAFSVHDQWYPTRYLAIDQVAGFAGLSVPVFFL